MLIVVVTNINRYTMNIHQTFEAINLHTHMTEGDTASIGPNDKVKVERRTKNAYRGPYGSSLLYAWYKARSEAKEALPTLVHLISQIEHQNLVIFRANLLAEEMETTPQRIGRHLKILQEAGLVEPDARHRANQYKFMWRICPFLMWVGPVTTREKYLETIKQSHSWFDYQEPPLEPETDFD